MDPPQEEIDRQMALKHEYSLGNITAFIIAGLTIVTVAVLLRLWARRISKIPWKSDDYTLVIALILTIAAQSCQLNWIYNGGLGRHTLTIDDATYITFGKTQYAWDVLYTVAYPMARISLVLLYRRVFIQRWFRICCWILIFCYAGYALGSAVADLCQALPINANWNKNVPPRYHINDVKLYVGNSAFNISTDVILLILPLIVIWGLNMSFQHKIGLSLIFSLGVLTVVASIMRLITYYDVTTFDPLYTIAAADWWTMVEMDLGLLCPCLVTFRPLLASGYLVFASRLSPRNRERLDRFTGQSSPTAVDERSEGRKNQHAADKMNIDALETSRPSSMRTSTSHLEAQTVGMDEKRPPMPGLPNGVPHGSPAAPQQADGRDKDGIALDQEAALAGLDPRTHDRHATGQNLGISTHATANGSPRDTPAQGIAVSRDYRQSSDHTQV